MSIKVTRGKQKLKPAYFIATVESPLPFLSQLSIQMCSNYESIAKMLGTAMEQENTIASVLIMAVAEYGIETGVDTLRLLNETLTDLRKLKAAAEAGTEGDNVEHDFSEMMAKFMNDAIYSQRKKPNQ